MATNNTLPNTPLINTSQATKLKRLTDETKVAKASYEKLDKELKEYRNSLPIPRDTEQVVGGVKVKKTWVDGNESFDIKQFREDHPEEAGPIARTVRRVVEHYIKRGKGYEKYTITEIDRTAGK